MANDYKTGPFIDSVTLPSGSVYWLKDSKAREDIEAIQGVVTGVMSYAGQTTTPLVDGSTATSLTIDGETKTFNESNTGSVVIYGEKEFVWNGTKWNEFGSTGSLKALAFKDSATGSTSYTPAGTVSKPTFTGSTFNSTGSYTPAGTVTVSTANKTTTVSTASGAATYTPGGTVSQPTFTGSTFNSTGNFTPAGTITVSTANKTTTVSTASGTATYTPGGSVTVSTANKNTTVSTASGTATYTPGGTVSAPTISVKTAGTTATIKNPTAVSVTTAVVAAAPGAAAPANNLTYYSVSGQNLSLYQLGFAKGNSITTSNVTVKTGDAAYESTAPQFTGTGARLVTGNIAVTTGASFSGTGARLQTGNIAVTTAASFNGTEDSVSVVGTPTGTVSQPTFSGTGVRLQTGNIATTTAASFAGTSATITVNGTPKGDVSQPTFTGTSSTITITAS